MEFSDHLHGKEKSVITSTVFPPRNPAAHVEWRLPGLDEGLLESRPSDSEVIFITRGPEHRVLAHSSVAATREAHLVDGREVPWELDT
jgi:hypothetical protein